MDSTRLHSDRLTARLVVAGLCGVVGIAVAVALFGRTGTDGAIPAPSASAAAPPDAPEPAAPSDAVPADEVDEGVDGDAGVAAPGEVSTDWTDGAAAGSPEDVDLDPATPPIDPCALIVDPDQRFVIPAAVELPSGAFQGRLEILNCSSGLLDIDLAAAYGLAFVADELALPPGVSMVDFTVDADAVGVGAFALKFKVTQIGCCADYGEVVGFRQGFDPDIALDLPLTAGDGQGGCKAGCITTVWMEGNQLNTAVELTVATTVAADIEVRVSDQAPVTNQAGDPWMPGIAPVITSDGPTSEIVGTIGGLEAATTYHLLVTATDDDGTSTFSDSFTTVEPVDHPGGLVGNDPAPGCSAGCITHALIGDITHTSARLTMKTSMPATMAAFIGTAPVDQSGTVPTIPNPLLELATPEPWTSWTTVIDSLEGDTTYHVLLRATDENGRRDYQVGSFTTPEAPEREVVISVERIDIEENGDLLGKGEVRFGFAYDSSLIGTRSEQKLGDGATVRPDAYNAVVVDLAPGEATARFEVMAGERDVAVVQFCESPAVGLACQGITWTTARTVPVTLDDIEGMPRCTDYGLAGAAADDHCEVITDVGEFGDRVAFSAVIRYQLR